MDEEQTIKENSETIALAEMRQEEAEEEEESAAEDIEEKTATYQARPKVSSIELLLMLGVAFFWWGIGVLLDFTFALEIFAWITSGVGVGIVWLWYKFKHLNPPSLSTSSSIVGNAAGGLQFTDNVGGREQEFIKKIPGGSDFLFFFGAFATEAIPFVNFLPTLPALVIAIYLANRR